MNHIVQEQIRVRVHIRRPKLILESRRPQHGRARDPNRPGIGQAICQGGGRSIGRVSNRRPRRGRRNRQIERSAIESSILAKPRVRHAIEEAVRIGDAGSGWREEIEGTLEAAIRNIGRLLRISRRELRGDFHAVRFDQRQVFPIRFQTETGVELSSGRIPVLP